MKPLNALKTILATTLLTAVTLTGLPALAASGGSSTGGGFEYRDTVMVSIEAAQTKLVEGISITNQAYLNSITKEFTNKVIDKNELVRIIRRLEQAPLENKLGVIKGHEQNLDLMYSPERQSIIALKPLFEKVEKGLVSGPILARKLVHEATHLFGIGLGDSKNSDDVSYGLSVRLTEVFLKRKSYCGMEGSIEQRQADCETKKPDSGLVMAYLDEQEMNHSWVSIWNQANGVNGLVASLRPEMSDGGYPPKYSSAESFCEKLSDLNGQVQWRIASDDEVEKIDPAQNYFKATSIFYRATVALSGDRLRVVETNALGFNAHRAIKPISKDYSASGFFQIYCVSEQRSQ